MHLIATHENTDFDALAACVAAQRLDPGSVVGLARRLGRGVRDYWALHKDRFLAIRLSAIDPDEVTQLTIVDLRDRRRLRHVERILARRDDEEQLVLHVYDHHPSTDHDIVGDLHVVEPLGAITTALVERLKASSARIDAADATLFALGIHADTGSLTLGHTTPRDARAVAWLLERGADLSMIDRYLHPPLSEAQREALLSVLGTARRETVNGVEVGVAQLKSATGIDGLAEVTSEARRLGGFDALIIFLEVGSSSVQVVGRSRSALVDVGSALSAIGGGGHRGAASAIVRRGASAEALLAEVLAAMRRDPPRPRVVGEVMSRPARIVRPELTLDEAFASLTRWRIQGAPVVRGEEVVGVVSIRDIARARTAGRGALPVASHMSSLVHTTTAREPLERALELMVTHDIGRLPVLDDEGVPDGGALIGIVTRSDVRRCLYGNQALTSPSEAR